MVWHWWQEDGGEGGSLAQCCRDNFQIEITTHRENLEIIAIWHKFVTCKSWLPDIIDFFVDGDGCSRYYVLKGITWHKID